ncbi:ABC transporter ATP-binding protein [Marasmitruncus massiliensis]|uniref:ABC transporter ATP-binding protein n=1 Tax=Marasmitruncus massiliensis TaxID=1944642 RepID=UPI001FA84E13|nr:ABC transporter ATP-binding protein [Marasmitruncus massiliensis]
MDNLLEVRNLNVDFSNGDGQIRVISDLSFTLVRNEVLGIVGESGSGKSVTSLSVMRLLPTAGAQTQGEVLFEGKDLLSVSEQEMQQIRGNRVAMIFQEPMTSLNPIHTCGRQITESILLHSKMTKKEAQAKALQLLELCGIPDAPQRLKEYPHQLSGGMRQRVMIAIALACDPDLLIADEPTTALDVTIQAQILKLMKDIRKQRNMSVIMITHDLGIVSDFCDRVAVMYTGEIVETAPVKQLFRDPLHPYTTGLINALPRLTGPAGRLEAIEGMVPDAGQMPEGCRFNPRCKQATERCRREHPMLKTLSDGRCVRCFLFEDKDQGEKQHGE